MSYLLMALLADSGGVLKSVRIKLSGRPAAAPPPVDQADVEALRSAADLARVGLWPPPRRS
ncbi:MAG: hypothetical protein QOH72_4341 [Solirubrobacteraceae bacterium]|jgi:hypothetical protein|nr:hypothetical protein [Solirubrobacteraceae bacterium]